MDPQFREDLSPEAEEQSLLEAVIRQRLVKTLQAGKDSVICKVWNSAMLL
jgi:hypothetical protein